MSMLSQSIIAISVAMISPFLLPQHSAACQSSPPVEAIRQSGNKPLQDTLAELLSRRMEYFTAAENPDTSDEDKILAFKQLLEIDQRIMDGLKSASESFRGTMPEPEMESIGNQIHRASASSALSLSRLFEQAQDYPELAKILDYYVTQIGIAYGVESWRMAEAKALLRQAQWLVAAEPAQQNKWAAARQDFNEANLLLRQREWQAGLPKLTNAKLALEALGATDQFFYGEAVANLAEAQFGIGDLESTEKTFQLAIETNEKIFGQPTPTMANMRVSFSRVYRALNDSAKELALCQAAEKIARSVHGAPSIEVSQNLLLQGDVYLRANQAELAIERIKQSALMAADTSLRTGHQTLADSIMVIDHGRARLTNHQQHAAAAEIAEIGLGLVKQTQGENSVWAARWIVLVAQSQAAAGSLESALKNFAVAHTIFETIKSDPANIVRQDVEGYMTYANALRQSNDLAQAHQIIATAVELAKRLEGEDSMLYITAVQNQSVILQFGKQHAESETAIAAIMPWLEKNLGEAHVEFGRILRDRALNLEHVERWSEARDQWRRLQKIQSTGGIQNYPGYQETIEHLSVACAKSGDDAEAKKWADEVKSLNENK